MGFKFKTTFDTKSFYGTKKIFQELTENEASRRVKAAGEYYLARVKKNASVTNYSLKELKQRGHPYARKHGRIVYRSIPPLRRFQIHTRTGNFLRSIRGRYNTQSKSYTLFLQGAPEYAEALISGSKYMLPRDVFAGTFNVERRQITKIIKGEK